MINALRYTRKLEEVGFSRDQAETHVQIMTEIVEGDLVTKQDMTILGQGLQQDSILLRQEFKQETTSIRQDMTILSQKLEQESLLLRRDMVVMGQTLENKIAQAEYRMTIKIGAMLTVAIGILAALQKL